MVCQDMNRLFVEVDDSIFSARSLGRSEGEVSVDTQAIWAWLGDPDLYDLLPYHKAAALYVNVVPAQPACLTAA